MKRMGRPPKPEGEKFVGRLVKCPPELWERLDAAVPEGERAGFVRRAIEEALRRRSADPEE